MALEESPRREPLGKGSSSDGRQCAQYILWQSAHIAVIRLHREPEKHSSVCMSDNENEDTFLFLYEVSLPALKVLAASVQRMLKCLLGAINRGASQDPRILLKHVVLPT